MNSEEFFKEWGTREASSYEYWPHAMTHTVKSIVWNDVFEAFVDRLYDKKIAEEMKPGGICGPAGYHDCGCGFSGNCPYFRTGICFHPPDKAPEPECKHWRGTVYSPEHGLSIVNDDSLVGRGRLTRFPYCPQCGEKLNEEGV